MMIQREQALVERGRIWAVLARHGSLRARFGRVEARGNALRLQTLRQFSGSSEGEGLGE
jgi:hypothetical protein